MASYVSILLFFVYFWGFGYTATLLVKKNAKNWFERNLMRIGLGFGGFSLLGVLLNLLHLPIDWKIFLVASLAGPTYGLWKCYKLKSFTLPSFKLTKSTLSIFVMLLIFSMVFYMYGAGSFKYPYLEDDDPWGHAIAAKFVANTKDLDNPDFLDSNLMGYIDPYPPTYAMMMGILHQTSPRVNWTLKFFNSLVISLGIIFFYFFAVRFIGNKNKALFATALFAMIPSYLSHFIWASSLMPTLFFVAMYTYMMAREDRRWLLVSTLVLAGVLFTHQLQPFKMGILIFLFILLISVAARKIQWMHFATMGGAVVISLLWWLPGNRWLDQFRNTGVARESSLIGELGAHSGIFDQVISIVKAFPRYFSSGGGSATRTYTFSDFFFAQKTNMINNPIGIGIVIYLLVTIGVVALVLMFRNELKNGEYDSKWVKHASTGITAVLTFIFGVLVLRYLSLLFGGLELFPFLFSLWLDFLFFSLAALFGILVLFVNRDNKQIFSSTILVWLAVFYLLVTPSSFNFPFGISPFRTWMFLAVPVALVAMEGAYLLRRYGGKIPFGGIVILAVILLGVFYTSGIQKYTVNTAQWPPGQAWTSIDELRGYSWILGLPPNTKIFPFSGRGESVSGFNGFNCLWCEDEVDFRRRILDRSPEELRDWLREHEYEYLILDGMAFRMLPRYTDHTRNETDELVPLKIEEIARSGIFPLAHQTQGAIILRVT
jgi:hypothetical protein